MTNVMFAYFGLVIVMCLLTFMVYGWDKQRAVSGGRRVPERTLHILAFLGGWPGALLAQKQFRHKTKKTPFLIVFWIMVTLHVAVVGAVVSLYWQTPYSEAGASSGR